MGDDGKLLNRPLSKRRYSKQCYINKQNKNKQMSKEFQLPREFTKKWQKALRSGEYKQTVGKLGDGRQGYCCLGVACSIAGIEDDDMIDQGTLEDLQAVGQEIPEEIPLGLINSKLSRSFVMLNDDQGKTFLEVADWIDDNVELL